MITFLFLKFDEDLYIAHFHSIFECSWFFRPTLCQLWVQTEVVFVWMSFACICYTTELRSRLKHTHAHTDTHKNILLSKECHVGHNSGFHSIEIKPG